MHPLNTSARALVAAVFGAAFSYGCASSAPAAKDESAAPTSPLAGMLGRPVVVFPTQYLATAGPSGTWDISTENATLLPVLDEEIAAAFTRRGVKNWTFAREITASAVRNGGLAGDPRELSVAGIRRVKAGDTPLPEPLASQIRGLVSLTNARFAVLPLEARVDVREGQRKGAVRILLVDSRTARVVWAEDIDGDPMRDPLRDPAIASEALSPYGFRLLSRDLASRFADMVVAQ